MAIDKEIIALLSEFGKDITVDLKSNLKKRLEERAARTLAKSKYKDKSVKKLTSRLEASILANPVKYVNGGLLFTLTMNDYWIFVNEGRNPGSVSSDGQSKIAEWSRTRDFAEKIRVSDLEARKEKQSKSKSKRKLKTLKKMPFDRAKKTAAFLIARKLKKKSLEPTHFFDEVIKDGRIEELQSKIAKLINTEIIIDIQQTTKK
jgi:hypothetical protein